MHYFPSRRALISGVKLVFDVYWYRIISVKFGSTQFDVPPGLTTGALLASAPLCLFLIRWAKTGSLRNSVVEGTIFVFAVTTIFTLSIAYVSCGDFPACIYGAKPLIGSSWQQPVSLAAQSALRIPQSLTNQRLFEASLLCLAALVLSRFLCFVSHYSSLRTKI